MPTAARRSRVSTKDPIHITVPASGAGKPATGTNAPPVAPAQARPAAVAKPATSTKPATAKSEKAPEGLPITPVKGGKVAVKDATGVVATRATVGSVKAPAIRLFTGKIADLKVGATFGSHHAKAAGHPNCGTWTVIATIKAGAVAGTLPDGTKSLGQNIIS